MAKKNTMTTPTDPKDREKLKIMLTEMTKCMRRKADESEQQKDTAKQIKGLFGLATKHINKLAKTMYKQNYSEVVSENQAFEELYETIVEGKIASK